MRAAWPAAPVLRAVGVLIVIAITAASVSLSAPALAGVCQGLDGGPGDLDGDGFVGAIDCDDDDPGVATASSATLDLQATAQPFLLSWDPPNGGSPPDSYEVLRSSRASDFLNDPSATCLDVNGQDLHAEDPDVPQQNAVFYYLPRARNACGAGSLGTDSTGSARAGRDCDCSVLCDDGDACTRASCQNGQCAQTTNVPTILHAPQSGATCAGSSVRFDVRAEGSGNLDYQWFLNGMPAGANQPVLSLPAVLAADDGAQVSVEVSDGCGASLSPPATLTVFANTASCDGGLDGFEAPNGAGRVVTAMGPIPWMAPEQINKRASADHASMADMGPVRWMSPESVRGHGGDAGGSIRVKASNALGSSNWPRHKRSAVHGHSGEYSRTEIDLAVPGRGFDLVWSRTYRSRELVESPQGHQWTHGYDRRVAADLIVAGNLLVHDGTTARIDSYAPSPTLPNCWEKEGFFRTLCIQPDGRYVLRFADKHEWVFRPLDGTPAEGLIEASVDRNGNDMQFQYDPAGRLETVVDTLGRPFQIGYHGSGRLASVTDYTGREVRYEYYGPNENGGGAGDLKSVTTPVVLGTPTGNDFPQGRTTTYSYTQGFADARLNHNLLTITDPKGQIWLENVYGPTDIPADGRFDRVDRQISPDGVLAFTYAQLPADPAFPQIVSTTIVNDNVGNVTHYEYDALGRVVRKRDFTGRAPNRGLPSDDAQNTPVNPLRPTDPPAFEVAVLYNSDFLPVFVQPSNGNQVDLQYDSANPDPRLRGNLLQRLTHPGPLGGAQASIVESWGYTTDLGTTYGSVAELHEMGHNRGRVYGATVHVAAGLASRNDDDDSSDDDDMVSMGRRSDRNSMAHISDFGMSRVAGRGGGGGGAVFLSRAGFDSMSHDEDSNSEMYDPLYGNMRGFSGGRYVLRAGVPLGFDRDSVDDMSSDGDSNSEMYVSGSSSRPVVGGSGGAVFIPGRVYSFATSHTDGRGLTYDFTYDPQGNLRTAETPLVVTGTPGGVPQVILHQWDYNAFGQVTQYTSPAGRVDRYSYYPGGQQEGYLEVVSVDDPNLSLTTTYEYDAVGNVVRVIDPRGNPTVYVRNALNEVVRIVDSPPFLYETDVYYDANGLPYRIDRQNIDEQGNQDPNGYLSSLRIWDPMDRVVRAVGEVDSGGECIEWEYEYDGNANRVLVRGGEATNGNDPDNTVRTLYDERDLVFRESRAPNSPDVSTTQYDYDGNGNVGAVRQGLEDPAGSHDTAYAYDGYDRLVTETDALGNVATYGYDANDRLVHIRVDGEDKQGAGLPAIRLFEGDYLYDEVNRLVRTDLHHFETVTGNPIGDGFATTTWAYAPDHRLVLASGDTGATSQCVYDTARRRSVLVDPKGNNARYRYDAGSNVIEVTEQDLSDSGGPPEFFVTTYEYDSLNRLERRVDNLGNDSRVEFDSRDNARVRIDELDNVTRYAYDGMNRRVRVVRELTDTGTGAGTLIDTIDLVYCWDDSNRLVCAEDDNGNRTTYEYDSLDRLVSTTHPDGTQSVYETDVHDVEVRYTAPTGTVVDRVYDELDRLVATTVTPGPGVGGTSFEQFTYDGLYRLRDASDDDVNVELEYDSLSNVVRRRQEIVGQPPRFVLSTHDGLGNVVDRVYPSGRTVSTVYDELNRPTQVVTNGALAAEYFYVGPHRVERVTRPNGVDTVHEYDGLRRRNRTLHVDGGGVALSDTGLLWDPAGNVIEVADLLPGGAVSIYEYDSMYRLIRSVDPVSGATDYDLDGVSNRTLVSGGPDPGQYFLDPSLPVPGDYQCNQYTDTPRGPRQYDESGNLISSGADLGGVVYDFRNRMVQATGNGGAVYAYRWSALGDRVEKQETVTLDTVRYYSSGGRVLEEQDLSNLPRATYVHGVQAGELLQFHEETDLDFSGALDTYWYLTDHLSSVQALTDASGAVAESYAYGDYGSPEVFDSLGVSLGTRSAKGNPRMFSGAEFQGELYLYAFDDRETRQMDPRVGRFVSRNPAGAWADPLQAGNAFSYAGSNPVSLRGTSSKDDDEIRDFYWTQTRGPFRYSVHGHNPLNRPTYLDFGGARRGAGHGGGAIYLFGAKGRGSGGAKESFYRLKPHINIGTIGHVDHGKTTLTR